MVRNYYNILFKNVIGVKIKEKARSVDTLIYKDKQDTFSMKDTIGKVPYTNALVNIFKIRNFMKNNARNIGYIVKFFNYL